MTSVDKAERQPYHYGHVSLRPLAVGRPRQPIRISMVSFVPAQRPASGERTAGDAASRCPGAASLSIKLSNLRGNVSAGLMIETGLSGVGGLTVG